MPHLATDLMTPGSPALEFLAGGGEMGERIRALDWSATALGPVDTWPQSLRSALSICLGSRFPIVIYWGASCTVLYNDSYAEILGKKHPWALGRPCAEVWSEIWDVIAPMLRDVLATGQATWSEDQLLILERRGYPEKCYFSFSFSPVRGVDGSVDGIFTAVIESTRRVLAHEEERKRAEALAEIDRAKTAFFSNVSHEFRTPLTLMLSPIDDSLADTAEPLAAMQRERLELIRRNGLRLQRLVNTLLDFSRIEAGRVQAAYAPTDLAALTADLASSFRSAIEKAGLRLIVDTPALHEPVYVDQEMWEKIVLNLVSNAFKFTFDGQIAVILRATPANSVELVVHDTGTGIPAAELSHVFERFHRVAGGKARTHEGTGIGLALVQELVRLHGGTVSVQSEEGRGTTFTVSIPLGTSHLPADRISAEPRASISGSLVEQCVSEALRWSSTTSQGPLAISDDASSLRRARILWADDNADMQDYVRRLLSTRYDVETVSNGQAALAAIRVHRPDLVLTDVMMPQVDGFDLLRAVRADPDTAELPVILLSARAGEESRIEGVQAGADDYLVKPFSRRELLACVEGQLRLAQVRRDGRRALENSREALREADRRKDEFLATLSHELRNPLAPLRNALQVMRIAGHDNAELTPIRKMMERQVNHLVRLVDDLLEMSRVSRGTLELRMERVDLNVIAAEALEVNDPSIQSRGHDVHVALCQVPVLVRGDPVRLTQAIGNLLNNATKYTDMGGEIWLTVRRAGSSAIISVRDNGSGISADALPRVFDLFHRGDRLGDGAGLGIGLTLVRTLVQMHGGTVTGYSAGEGKGSEFTVRLPLLALHESGPQRDRRVSRQLAPHRVLVVDDNRDAADSLHALLALLGAEVRVARGGPDALEAVKDFEPSVVLLDIGMPGMSGYEVARRIRADRALKQPTIVALTGWGQPEDRRRAAEAGFDHHLVKPADLVALQGILNSLEDQPRS